MNRLDEDYKKQDYNQIQHYWRTMSIYMEETYNALYELQDVLRLKSKKYRRNSNDLSADNIDYDWRE